MAALVVVVVAVPMVYAVDAGANVPNDGVCESTEVCVWKDSGYSGGKLDWDANDLHYSNNNFFNTATTVHDEVSSVRNKGTSCNVRMYVDDDQQGSSFLLYRPGIGMTPTEDGNLDATPNPSGFNDALDSHKWCP